MDIPSTFISTWIKKIKLPTDPNSILQAYLADHTLTYNYSEVVPNQFVKRLLNSQPIWFYTKNQQAESYNTCH